MNTLIAYHGKPAIKADILMRLRAHASADQLVQGITWEHGKGCAVGCTLHAYDHALYESRFGIPQMLACLEDRIFEGLPNVAAMKWPVRFMSVIKPGADLSRVGWLFLHWTLTDPAVNPGITHPLVAEAVKRCADVVCRMAAGEDPALVESAAMWAERAAWRAAWRAARAARSTAYALMADKLIELLKAAPAARKRGATPVKPARRK